MFSLAKGLQLILEIGEMYSLLTYLLADNWLIFRFCAQCMISNSEFVIIFIKTMYIKKIITGRFGFCDILNNKVHQASAFSLAGITFLDLDYSGYHKNLIGIQYCLW